MKLSDAIKKIVQLEAENSKLQQRLAIAEFMSFVPQTLVDDLIAIRKDNNILTKRSEEFHNLYRDSKKELETVRDSLKNLKDFLNKKP